MATLTLNSHIGQRSTDVHNCLSTCPLLIVLTLSFCLPTTNDPFSHALPNSLTCTTSPIQRLSFWPKGAAILLVPTLYTILTACGAHPGGSELPWGHRQQTQPVLLWSHSSLTLSYVSESGSQSLVLNFWPPLSLSDSLHGHFDVDSLPCGLLVNLPQVGCSTHIHTL